MNVTHERPFSNVEALRYGWRTTHANLKPLLTLGAIAAALAMLGSALTGPERGLALNPFLGPGIQVLQWCVALAFVRVALRLHDGRPVDLNRAGELLEGFFGYLLTGVLYCLVVAAGLALLVVPGVIWAVQFGAATFLVADAGLDPIEAFRESRRITRGARLQLLGFGLLLGLVNLVGALALGVGLLVTVPTTYLAIAYVLRRIQARSAAPRTEPVAPGPLAPVAS